MPLVVEAGASTFRDLYAAAASVVSQQVMLRAAEYGSLLTGVQESKGAEGVNLHMNDLEGDLLALREHAKLEFLWLHDNQLTSCEGVDECPQLRRLNLCKNRIGGSLRPLSKCAELTEAYLNDNGFTSDLESLRSCKKLEKLHLERNELKLLDADINSLGDCSAGGPFQRAALEMKYGSCLIIYLVPCSLGSTFGHFNGCEDQINVHMYICTVWYSSGRPVRRGSRGPTTATPCTLNPDE